MKEKDITLEVIKLSKEIAELWRMEIYEGCWVKINRKARLVESVLGSYYFTRDGQWSKSRGIPIPSISDCLWKLRELGESVALQDHILLTYAVGIMDESNEYKPCANSESPLEALLSALLEVLKK